MFSQEQLNALIKGLSGENENDRDCRQDSKDSQKNQNCSNKLSADQLLVIAGILCGGLKVESVVIDRRQIIQIVLAGSLRRKTQMEKLMDQIGQLPFDQVMKAFLGRL